MSIGYNDEIPLIIKVYTVSTRRYIYIFFYPPFFAMVRVSHTME